MAGLSAADGLGAIAINYGYYRYQNNMMSNRIAARHNSSGLSGNRHAHIQKER